MLMSESKSWLQRSGGGRANREAACAGATVAARRRPLRAPHPAVRRCCHRGGGLPLSKVRPLPTMATLFFTSPARGPVLTRRRVRRPGHASWGSTWAPAPACAPMHLPAHPCTRWPRPQPTLGRVGQVDELGRLRGGLRHAQEEAHAQRRAVLPLQHLRIFGGMRRVRGGVAAPALRSPPPPAPVLGVISCS